MPKKASALELTQKLCEEIFPEYQAFQLRGYIYLRRGGIGERALADMGDRVGKFYGLVIYVLESVVSNLGHGQIVGFAPRLIFKRLRYLNALSFAEVYRLDFLDPRYKIRGIDGICYLYVCLIHHIVFCRRNGSSDLKTEQSHERHNPILFSHYSLFCLIRPQNYNPSINKSNNNTGTKRVHSPHVPPESPLYAE